MKRILFIVIFIISIMTLNAQEIKYRRLLEPDGLSVMTTSLDVFEWGSRKISYALQFEVAPIEYMHQGYYLNVYFTTDDQNLIIPEKGKILIKTTQDTVISLTDCGGKYFREYNPELNLYDDVSRSTSYYDNALNRIRYTVHGKYPISDEDLATIIKDGVIKVRIETTGASFECEYKVKAGRNNLTAGVISRLYDVLVKETDLYYGL